ncbi:MAG: hypothetical protein IT180_04960 [Acidobacteria bacterium]|nr:hypothetical protein [Acidobacteriota bacterium]
MTRVTALLALFLTLPATAALAQFRVVDQSSPAAATDDVPFTWAIGGGSGQVLFQTVTAGIRGWLREIRVPLACADGVLRIEIRDVDPATGEPGTTVRRARNFAARRFDGPVTDEFQVLGVFPPLRMTPGDQFAFVLSNATGSCGVWPGPVGDPYAGGGGWFFAAPNTTIAPLGLGTGREDLPFETVVLRPRR